MEITYIGHSGFLLEWDTSYWLFDYYKGELPKLDQKKNLYVFVSHKHGDHYNPEIFSLKHQVQKVSYILSSDVKVKQSDYETYGLSSEVEKDFIIVKPNQELELCGAGDPLLLKTLKSTDSGVAFLLQYRGKTIYHAGDLNLWVWKEESKQYNNNMTAMFRQQMELLKDMVIDLAFAPLDPRQEEWYYLGLEELITTAQVKLCFPMHFWDKPEIITQYKQERQGQLKETKVIEVSHSGQKWEIEL